jgi:hypothetical protein
MKGTDNSRIEREIAALEELDRSDLLARWRLAFKKDAPPHLSRALMEKAIAYELQVGASSSLSPRTIRALKTAAKTGGPLSGSSLPARGTRLVREWNGVLHEVDVLEDSYLWRGERHRSLSVIARAITGTRWSGPRFFGVRNI